MENKVLAIGIPSYNGEKYIDRCIPTFIDERLKNKIEVIIVNDGSTDNTKKLAEKYEKLYPDYVRIINKENGGHGSAVNAALYSTEAKYYKVVDVDDWVDTEELVKLVDFLENNDADIISNDYNQVHMVTGASTIINNTGVEYGKLYNLSELNLKDICFTIHSTTYRTKLLQDHNIKLQEKTFFVDVEYQLLPFPYVNTVIFLENRVYKYMIGNVNQSVDIDNFVRRYDDHNRVVHRIIEFLKTAELNEYQKEYVYSTFEKVLYTHYALSSIYDKDLERGRKRSIEFDKYLKENNRYLYDFLDKKYSNIRKLRKRNFIIKNAKNSKLRLIKKLLLGN